MRFAAALVLVLCLPATALASRASLEGRSLPRLLSEDVSLLRFLPGVMSGLDRFFLVDVAAGSSSDLVIGPTEGSDDLAAVLLGDRTRFGYVLDGSTHNLVVSGRAGWGLVLGVSDGFTKHREETADTSGARYQLRETELSRRVARLGAGWTFHAGGERRVSVGAGLTYLDVDYSVRTVSVIATQSEVFEGGWKSSPGLGYDLTVQTISPGPGLQLGGRLALELLNEDSTIPTGLPLRRRYATLQAGWRVDTPAVDDLMVGVATSWSTESEVDLYGTTFYQALIVTERVQYYGAVFVSAEHEIRDGLRVRGGVLGPARFRETKRMDTREDESGFSSTLSEDSIGIVDSPLISLGGSWAWKSWLLELQVSRYLRTDSPVVRWAATLAF